VANLSTSGGGYLDLDTPVSAASYEAAMLAAGAGIEAVDLALGGEGENAFLLVRPPGHHALRTHGMGFCLFNNIAVAARHALEARGIERILIFDWDVHHGNGTQDAFYEEASVLFVSMHQQHHYPGTGQAEEIGAAEGRGFTANVPLPAGHGDAAVLAVFDRLLEPLARAFRPQLVLASAGYDSQFRDPLGGLTLSEEAFGWMGFRLRALAQDLQAAGPVCFLEGGYDPQMLGRSITKTLEGLAGNPVELPADKKGVEKGVVQSTIDRLAPFWPGVFVPE
jgi:acetoin utilization deacetylase AcuC-like enzyme